MQKKFMYTDMLGTVDYVDETDGSIIFRTCPRERNQVVFQIGTSDAERALKVAQLVEQDVAGIDVNMGCPTSFSQVNGMGAALLENPTKARSILYKLVRHLKVPVSCKIRVLPTIEETLKLCDCLVSSGISAIAVHGRTCRERPNQHENKDHHLRAIAEHVSVPVIASGGSDNIQRHSDIFKFLESSGCDSVMIGKAAIVNCSIFRSQGLLPIECVVRDYMRFATEYDNVPSNTQYCIRTCLKHHQTAIGDTFFSKNF